MGYDAIWISPTGKNIEGGTPYGEAYHVSLLMASEAVARNPRLMAGILGDRSDESELPLRNGRRLEVAV